MYLPRLPCKGSCQRQLTEGFQRQLTEGFSQRGFLTASHWYPLVSKADIPASSQAAYPSFPPKGEKLAHSLVPEGNPLGGLLLSPPNPPDGWASAGAPIGGTDGALLASPVRGGGAKRRRGSLIVACDTTIILSSLFYLLYSFPPASPVRGGGAKRRRGFHRPAGTPQPLPKGAISLSPLG